MQSAEDGGCFYPRYVKYLDLAEDGQGCGGRGALWQRQFLLALALRRRVAVDEGKDEQRAGRRLRKKSDLYDGGRRQVTSAPAAAKLCARASGRRGWSRRRAWAAMRWGW